MLVVCLLVAVAAAASVGGRAAAASPGAPARPPASAAEGALALRTVPARVYREPLASHAWRWAFRLVAKAPGDDFDADALAVEAFAGSAPAWSQRWQGADLAALGGDPLPSFAGVDETANFRLGGTDLSDAPVEAGEGPALGGAGRAYPGRVDRLRVTLAGRSGGRAVSASLEVPLLDYAPRRRLLSPLRGAFAVLAGHEPGEAHAEERSELFAYDLVSTARRARGRARSVRDFPTFGRPVYAPAAGVVVRARGDLADNRPGRVPPAAFYARIRDREERLAAAAGNVVVIDHGGGEFSLLGHLERGSVAVRAGQRVAAGQFVGRVGNSGNSTEPHLHYHLMDGPLLFRSEGLPFAFADVAADGPLLGGRTYRAAGGR